MPIPLCTRTLPNGHRCQQPALRDREVCRHHNRIGKVRRRSTHQMTMDRLRAEVSKFDFIELLFHLDYRLQHIRSAVEGYPEARAVLDLVLEQFNRMQQAKQKMEAFL